LSGCDVGRRSKPASESLKIVASAPAEAEGFDCELDAGSCGFAPIGPLVLRFDRWLLPTTANRQSLSLVTAGTALGVTLDPDYDVATRTIRYRFDRIPGGVAFTIRVPDADQSPNGFGFRAFDGAALDSRKTISFRTSLDSTPERAAASEPSAPTCAQVLATLANTGCSRVGCHSRQTSPQCASASPETAWDASVGACVKVPRMGLLLEDIQGLTTTAINHVAHETEDGTNISRRYESSGRFGDQMPIIDPGYPQNSYMIYKLVIGEGFNHELEARADHSDPLSPTAMTSDEISRARDWFIRFGPMPPDEIGTPDGVSLYDTYQVLSRWIHAGAPCP
jgi:hypothetical protein